MTALTKSYCQWLCVILLCVWGTTTTTAVTPQENNRRSIGDNDAELQPSHWFENNHQEDEHSLVELWTDNLESDSCAKQTDCTSCTSHSSWCHWCASDQACHAKGSPYGCFSGAACSHEDDSDDDTGGDDDDDSGNSDNDDENHDDDDDDGKSHNNKHCASHTSCQECTASSRFCHWCAHDNACHAMGSVYGCTTGVDCFSNDRCRRKEPTPLDNEDNDTRQVQHISFLPLVLILGVATLVTCCSTICFCFIRSVKDAYHELADPTLSEHEDNEPSRSRSINPQTRNSGTTENATGTMEETTALTPLLPADDAPNQSTNNPTAQDESVQSNPQQEGEAGKASTDPQGQYDNPLETDLEEPPPQQQQHDQGEEARTTPIRGRLGRQRPRRVQRLYQTCSVCYCLVLAVVAGLTFGSIRYFPKMPAYNVCNDNVAWKSLMDSMATMKVSADFEILISVVNSNGIDIALDKGGGTFTHENSLVGTFDIPPVTAKANAITDILILAHFTPERWEALSIGQEYYKGKLVLHVDAVGTIRVPVLWNFTFAGKFKNLVVHVNELSDRHYCHCQSWNGTTTTSSTSSNQFPNLVWELDDVSSFGT